MSKYEDQIKAWKAGELELPSVSTPSGKLNYFAYAIAVHVYQCKLMAAGMIVRGLRLRDLKDYYGIKGRSAKEVLPKLEQIKKEELWKQK